VLDANGWTTSERVSWLLFRGFEECVLTGEHSHMYGCHNLGNTGAEVQAAIKVVENIARSISAPFSTDDMDWLDKSKEW